MGKPLSGGVYVGIDPGKKGGIAAVDRIGQIVYAVPMPDLEKFPAVLSRLKIQLVAIEHAQVFPMDGKSRAFNYGVHFGSLQGALAAMSIPYILVKPRAWQKAVTCSPAYKCPKKRALVSANKIFKKTKSFWLPTTRHSVPHDGMIDSALIAEYCRRLKK